MAKDKEKEVGLDIGVATEILLESGPEEVIKYMVREIFTIWGVKLGPNGDEAFKNFMLDYAEEKCKENGVDVPERESLAANLIMISFEDMDTFTSIMRKGIINGAGEIAGFTKEEIKDIIDSLPY